MHSGITMYMLWSIEGSYPILDETLAPMNDIPPCQVHIKIWCTYVGMIVATYVVLIYT